MANGFKDKERKWMGLARPITYLACCVWFRVMDVAKPEKKQRDLKNETKSLAHS